MASATSSHPSLDIPVIDLARWINSFSVDRLLDGSSLADRTAVANELTTAFRTYGFATIINHSIPPAVLNSSFEMSKRFFSLSQSEKMLAPHPSGWKVHRGYSSPGLEQVSAEADWKESFDIGSEDNIEQPNNWLPESTLPGFRELMNEFYRECNSLSRSLLRALALGLGSQPEFLMPFHSGHNNQLRLLHYPHVDAARTRMGAHSDWSSFTLLFQDEDGLEIEHPDHPGEFIPLKVDPGACVVNIGDLMMRWSNDELKSTRHRVRLGKDRTSIKKRHSFAYFIAPDPETLIECLPSCISTDRPAKYPPVTQRDFNGLRAKETYPGN